MFFISKRFPVHDFISYTLCIFYDFPSYGLVLFMQTTCTWFLTTNNQTCHWLWFWISAQDLFRTGAKGQPFL